MISAVQQLVSPRSLKRPERGQPKIHSCLTVFTTRSPRLTLGTALSLQHPSDLRILPWNLRPSLQARVGTHSPHPSTEATFPSAGRITSVPSSKRAGVAWQGVPKPNLSLQSKAMGTRADVPQQVPLQIPQSPLQQGTSKDWISGGGGGEARVGGTAKGQT